MSATPPNRPSALIIEPIEIPATREQLLHALNELAVHGGADPRTLQDLRYITQLLIEYELGGAQAPPAEAATGIGMGYAYFNLTPILADGIYKLINTIPDAGGTYGNAALFNNVPNGVEVKEPVIVSVMLWAKDNLTTGQTTPRYLAVQLDKQKGGIDPSQLLVRVPTGFIWSTATAVYQGILLPGDIVRAVATAPVGGDPFSIIDGYASVLGVPVSVNA